MEQDRHTRHQPLTLTLTSPQEETQQLLQQLGGGEGEDHLSAAESNALREEKARFEEYRAEEGKKLQRERRVLERQAKALLKVPDRKEREELDGIKAELAATKKELQVRDARWKMTVERLKKRRYGMGR